MAVVDEVAYRPAVKSTTTNGEIERERLRMMIHHRFEERIRIH